MSAKPQLRFEPSPPLLRCVFAAIALAATVSTAVFIDALAQGAGIAAPLMASAVSIVVAGP